MGSRSKTNIANLAYIAGFLDGDGSLMLQIKKRSDTKRGVRFMATICFYQDSRHEEPLLWMRDILQVGYFSRRNDRMSELRINGFEAVYTILILLKPYIKFKSKQVKALLEACKILKNTKISSLTDEQLRKIVDLIFLIRGENYKSHNTLSKKELYLRLGLTP